MQISCWEVNKTSNIGNTVNEEVFLSTNEIIWSALVPLRAGVYSCIGKICFFVMSTTWHQLNLMVHSIGNR